MTKDEIKMMSAYHASKISKMVSSTQGNYKQASPAHMVTPSNVIPKGKRDSEETERLSMSNHSTGREKKEPFAKESKENFVQSVINSMQKIQAFEPTTPCPEPAGGNMNPVQQT